jgi:hypothetical protein
MSDTLRAAKDLSEREHVLIAAARGYDAASMTSLPDKLVAITSAAEVFARSNVAYALIGGLAVGVRSGVPRATLDVDFAVSTATDFVALRKALLDAGFSATGTFTHSHNFKHASGEPMQLAFDPAFDPMIERAEPVQLADIELRVVTKADLIAMKRLAAADPARRRSKALRDEADIALLEGDVPDPDEGW